MRGAHSAGLTAVSRAESARILILLTWLSILPPTIASAGEFNCARAHLKVDYVICRSDPAMQANAQLSAAWDAAYSSAAPDRKKALLADQFQWIKAFAAECGVPGVGVAAADPTGRTDACVIDRIQRRVLALRAPVEGDQRVRRIWVWRQTAGRRRPRRQGRPMNFWGGARRPWRNPWGDF